MMNALTSEFVESGGGLLNKSLIRGCVGALVLSVYLAPAAIAQPCAPFSTFQAMDLSQLETLQVKLTYLGSQDKPIPSIVFAATSHVPDATLFNAFHQPGINYSNDVGRAIAFTVSPSELQAMINGIAGLPAVTGGGVDPNPYFSFSMVNPGAGGACFEAVVSPAVSVDLFSALRTVFQSNPVALRRVTDLGCPLAIVDPARPVDVTAQVGVTFSGLRLNRATGLFVGTVSLQNKGASSIDGPLSLVVFTSGNVSLANGAGTTCGTTPVGVPFLNFPLPGNVMAPGATTQAVAQFKNPDAGPITPTTKVLAGPGAR